MPSSRLGSVQSRTTSSAAFHHHVLEAHTVERRQACYAIIAFEQHKWSNNIERNMTLPPLDCTHGRTTSRWHAIIVFRQHTRSDDVGLDKPSSHLGSIHGRMTSGVACHHRVWEAHTVERHRAWHDITALGLHSRSDDVGRDMPSSRLDSIHGRTRRAWHAIITFGQHKWSNDVKRGMTSPPLESTHDRQCQAWHDITGL